MVQGVPCGNEPPVMAADIARLDAATGFVPSIALADGLAALWAQVGEAAQAPTHPRPMPSAPPPGVPPPAAIVQPSPRPEKPPIPADYDHAARLFRTGRHDEARTAVIAVLAARPRASCAGAC